MRSDRVRVLVADDSATVRAALTALLRDDPALEVVGEARDGLEAVDLAKVLRPDVITMDVLMPRLDGLGAIAAIMAEAPSRILVVSSVVEDRQLDLSFRAIAAGALELISKPQSGKAEDLRAWGARVAESIRVMAEVPVVGRRKLTRTPLLPRVPAAKGTVDAFGIAASTGGPAALALLLGALPGELTVPIFIAQHIAEGFTDGLIRWFSGVSPLAVKKAENGEAARPGHVYLPPDGHDLEIDPEGLLRVIRSNSSCCPSGDRLLSSVARAYGSRAGGMVLTGMGADGAAGLLAIREAGGSTIAQEEASCVVYGMPKSAYEMGAAQHMLPLEMIASFVCELSGTASPATLRIVN